MRLPGCALVTGDREFFSTAKPPCLRERMFIHTDLVLYSPFGIGWNMLCLNFSLLLSLAHVLVPVLSQTGGSLKTKKAG